MRVRALVFNMTGYCELFSVSTKTILVLNQQRNQIELSQVIDFGCIGEISISAAGQSSGHINFSAGCFQRRELANDVLEHVVTLGELRLASHRDIRVLEMTRNGSERFDPQVETGSRGV